MAKVKFVMLLPLRFNDKTPVPRAIRNRILDDLFRLGNGYHIAGTGKGAYRMRSGQKQVDVTSEVWIVIDEEHEGELRAMVAGFAELLGQEAIYLERTSGTIEFIPPPTEEG